MIKDTRQMEKRRSPLNDPQLRIQGAKPSQDSDMAGGNTFATCKMLEGPEEKDVWFLEMGDDSVFYSDEEQSYQDKEAIASNNVDSSRCKRLVNSVEDCETNQQQATDPEGLNSHRRSSEMDKEEIKHVVWTEELKRNQTAKTERACASDHGEPAADYDVTPGKLVKSSGIVLQPNCTSVHMQKHQLKTSATKVHQQFKEEVVMKTPTSNQLDIFNEESYPKQNEMAEMSELPSGAEFHKSGDRQPEADLEVHAGLSLNPIPSNSAPLKKSGFNSFNHLTSSKYRTVSYRRIRRGNTQEKIQEFEVMFMNL